MEIQSWASFGSHPLNIHLGKTFQEKPHSAVWCRNVPVLNSCRGSSNGLFLNQRCHSLGRACCQPGTSISFRLHALYTKEGVRSLGPNPWRSVVFSVTSTDQSNAHGSLKGQREKYRTFSLLSPKRPSPGLRSEGCVSGKHFLSSGPDPASPASAIACPSRVPPGRAPRRLSRVH